MDRTQGAELQVIAACLLGGVEVIDAASDHVSHGDFAHPQTGRAFRCMTEMVRRGEPIDVLTLSWAMSGVAWDATKPGGNDEATQYMGWLINLEANCATTRQIEHYAKRIRTASRLRRLQAACAEAIESARRAEDTPEAAEHEADKLIEALLAIGDGAKGATAIRVGAAVKGMLEQFRLRAEMPLEKQYIRTGLSGLDALIDGYRPGHLYLVGARSGEGKTAFKTFAAAQAATQGGAVLYATAEVPDVDIAQRLVTNVARVDGRQLERMGLDQDDTTQVVGSIHRINGWCMSILDEPAMTIGMLDREVRRHVKRHADRLGVVLVDYLQLVRASGKHASREQEVAEVADGLLEIAKRHHVALIAGAQLNRANTARADKRPQSADLRESSRAEHNASVVLMLYRPAMNGDETASAFDAEVIVRKNRLGPLGTALCSFDAARNGWKDRARA